MNIKSKLKPLSTRTKEEEMMKEDVKIEYMKKEVIQKLEGWFDVQGTIASPSDSILNAVGMIAFAEWFTGDWRKLLDIVCLVEVKTLAHPFRDTLNLLVREDDVKKRISPLYVLVVLDVPKPQVTDILPGTEAIIAGFAYGFEVKNAPLKDFGSKFGGEGGSRCHFIPIFKLHPMEEFIDAYIKFLNSN